MTIALVEQRTFHIEQIVEQYGWVNDMAKVPEPKTEKFHYYSVKAPGVSYIGVPVYWLFTKIAPHLNIIHPTQDSTMQVRAEWFRATTWVLRIFSIQIPCFFFLIWFERYLRTISRDTLLRLSAVAAAGLGTNYLAYSLMFASHALFAVAAFVSFAIIEREFRNSEKHLNHQYISKAFWAGWFAGWSTLLEYHALPVSIILSVYGLCVFYQPKRLIAFIMGGTFHVACMMFFQWQAYGNPLTPGHKMVESGLSTYHQKGLFGVTIPNLEHIQALWFDLEFGFFGTSPFMWIGLIAIPFMIFVPLGTFRQRKLLRISSLVWIVGLFILSAGVSGFGNWRGGWTLGPRFLGAAPPFFAMSALYLLEWFAIRHILLRNLARGIAAGLAFTSILSIGIVALVYNTLPPESITRPFIQFALPLIRTGFVAHHIAEWFGFQSINFWYFVAGCTLLIPILIAFWYTHETWYFYIVRISTCVLIAFLVIHLSFRSPKPTDLTWAMTSWEPKGRDRITEKKQKAIYWGAQNPCLWYQLATLERIVNLTHEAEQDEKRVNIPLQLCISK